MTVRKARMVWNLALSVASLVMRQAIGQLVAECQAEGHSGGFPFPQRSCSLADRKSTPERESTRNNTRLASCAWRCVLCTEYLTTDYYLQEQ